MVLLHILCTSEPYYVPFRFLLISTMYSYLRAGEGVGVGGLETGGGVWREREWNLYRTGTGRMSTVPVHTRCHSRAQKVLIFRAPPPPPLKWPLLWIGSPQNDFVPHHINNRYIKS